MTQATETELRELVEEYLKRNRLRETVVIVIHAKTNAVSLHPADKLDLSTLRHFGK